MRERGVMVALCVLWSMAGLQAIAGYDVWWHLATGRAIVETGSLVPTDPWSYTAAGEAWPTKDVLADLVFHGLYAAGGGTLLSMVKLLVPLAMLGVMVTIMRRSGAPDTAIALLATLAFPAASFRFIVRPVIFSLLMMLVYWLIIEAQDRRLSTRGTHHPAFLALPVIHLAWMWTHREALLGAGLVGLYALDVLAGWVVGSRHTLRPRPGSAVKGAAGVLLVCTCIASVTFLGPAGARVLAISAGGETSHVLRGLVPNWHSADAMTLVQHFPTWLFLLLGLMWAMLRGAPVRLWKALAMVGFVGLGMWAIRFLPYFALTAPLVIASAGPLRVSDTVRRVGRTLLAPWPAAAVVVATTLVLFTASVSHGRALGPGFDQRQYPQGAVRFLRKHMLAGDMLHSLQWGGYLLYHLSPPSRVFVDGRSDVVYPADVIALSARAPRDPGALDEIEARWPPDFIITAYDTNDSAYDYLTGHPSWVVIYWDDRSLVRARVHGPHDPMYAFAYDDLSPASPLESMEDAVAAGRTRAVRAEVQRFAQAAPDTLMAHFLIAYLLAVTGEDDDAMREQIRAMIRIMPSFAGVRIVEARASAREIMKSRTESAP